VFQNNVLLDDFGNLATLDIAGVDFGCYLFTERFKYCKGRNYWVVFNLGELGGPADHPN
jgi:hypothetical protein